MNRLHPFFLICLLILVSSQLGLSFERDSFWQPRLFLGGEYGYFRISLDNFENLYENRWGAVPGAHVGVRVYSSYYLALKYRHFEKSGKQNGLNYSPLNTSDAKWDEDWYTIGVRINPNSAGIWDSYYGFGYVIFKITEKPGLSVYNDNISHSNKKSGDGFFLEIGILRYFHNNLAGFIELEISSGGIGGKTGFEGQSVGGYLISAGFTIWI